MIHWTRIAPLALLLGAACGDANPYGADRRTVPIQPVEAKEAPPPKVYAIEAPAAVTCNEGVPCEFTLRGTIDGRGAPIDVASLPDSATYDAAAALVRWTPSREDSVDPSDARATNRVHLISVALKDGADTPLEKTVVLIAKARAQ